MKIYVNENYEIKAIGSTINETLTVYEVDRELVFGNMSDFMILNYCYKQEEYGFSIYPSKDYNMLQMLDKVESKISMIIENQKAILAGDMQTLAINLYPEDFTGNITTLEEDIEK